MAPPCQAVWACYHASSGKWASCSGRLHQSITPERKVRGLLGIGNQRGPSGWHLRRQTVAAALYLYKTPPPEGEGHSGMCLSTSKPQHAY